MRNSWKAAYAAVIALATPMVAGWEGLRVRAYLDPVGIPTICYGETEGVKMGDVKTKAECDKMLTFKMAYLSWRVDNIVIISMKPETHAAMVSFVYNVGEGAFKRSTLLKKLNAGDVVGACMELDRWTYAGGRQLTGLVKRRAAERDLCLKGAV